MQGKIKVNTDPQTKCSSCEASDSYVALGRREYFIPWGSYCLCDKCHRFAIMEKLNAGQERRLEPHKGYGDIHWIILGDLMATLKKCWPERVMKMRKWPRTESEDLGFVLKYCLASTYPASERRCPYAKAKLLAGLPEIPARNGDCKKVDGIFLCRYPDEKLPTHEAHLTSELTHCPDPNRRKMIDTFDVWQVSLIGIWSLSSPLSSSPSTDPC